MIYPEEKLKIEVKSNMHQGKGDISITHISDQTILGQDCRLFAKVTVKPGDSVGKHPHHGEKEIYYFINGQGTVWDDQKIYAIKSGDVMVTSDGHSHSVKNTGTDDLEFIALILKDSLE